jgi:hypothetical protein
MPRTNVTAVSQTVWERSAGWVVFIGLSSFQIWSSLVERSRPTFLQEGRSCGPTLIEHIVPRWGAAARRPYKGALLSWIGLRCPRGSAIGGFVGFVGGGGDDRLICICREDCGDVVGGWRGKFQPMLTTVGRAQDGTLRPASAGFVGGAGQLVNPDTTGVLWRPVRARVSEPSTIPAGERRQTPVPLGEGTSTGLRTPRSSGQRQARVESRGTRG